jgi:hypothetical protein
METERDLFSYQVALAVIVAAALLIVLGVLISKAPVEKAEPLEHDDQFMKAQFCTQTGRIPYVTRYHVTCYDYRHGGKQEDAP